MRCRFLLPVTLSLILAPVVARADGWCGVDTIQVSSRADSIFVSHRNALWQSCLKLTVSATPLAQIINFYEGDIGRPCPLFCCFDHLYGAAGLAPGHYTIRVYDEMGQVLYGEQDVDVAGPAGSFEVFLITQGDPLCPEPTVEGTWGSMRLLYR